MASTAFSISSGKTVNLACATTTASVALPITASTFPVAYECRVVNAGTVTAFIRFDTTAATATADAPILPGTAEVFHIAEATAVSGITASGTTTLYFTVGNGQ